MVTLNYQAKYAQNKGSYSAVIENMPIMGASKTLEEAIQFTESALRFRLNDLLWHNKPFPDQYRSKIEGFYAALKTKFGKNRTTIKIDSNSLQPIARSAKIRDYDISRAGDGLYACIEDTDISYWVSNEGSIHKVGSPGKELSRQETPIGLVHTLKVFDKDIAQKVLNYYKPQK